MAPRPPCAQRPARRLDPPAYAPSPERRLPPSFPWLRLLAGVCLLPLAAWGAGALWFQFPGGAARGVAVAAWAALHLWLLGLLIVGRPLRAGRRWWAGWALALVALLVWWHTLRPSNDRDWADEVSRMPQGTVQGDHVRLRTCATSTGAATPTTTPAGTPATTT